MATLKWALAIITFTCALVHAQQAEQGSTDSEARGLFEAGRAAFDGGRFSEALEHFEAAYALSGRPQLLYNIGHTAERLRNDARALEAFREYLRRLPEVDNRVAVEARIRVLESHHANADADAEDTEAEPDGESEVAPRGPGGLVLMFGGAAAMAGGALSLGLAGNAARDVEDSDVGTPWSSVRDDARAADRRRIAGALVGGLGVALLAVGVAWHVSAKVDIEARANGLSVRGAF